MDRSLIYASLDLFRIVLTVSFVILAIEICLGLLTVQLIISQVIFIVFFFQQNSNKTMILFHEYFEFQANEMDRAMLYEMIFVSFESIGAIFVICEFGQRISNACGDKIKYVFDRYIWYLFPIEVQRILPTAILYVQEPIELKFFGSSSLNREQLKFVSIKNCSID